MLQTKQINVTANVKAILDAADYSAIRTLINVENGADVTDATNVGSSIYGVTAKTTPVDADTMALTDSAASNVLKKVTWANVKATIKTYYDSVSATLTNKTLTSPVLNTGVSGTAVKDEDNMASDSATHLATQQSIKAYADTKLAKSGGTMTGAIVTADHGTATDPEVVSVVYGTGSPPTASTTPIGTLFVQYTA